jgi:hypothetical protein
MVIVRLGGLGRTGNGVSGVKEAVKFFVVELGREDVVLRRVAGSDLSTCGCRDLERRLLCAQLHEALGMATEKLRRVKGGERGTPKISGRRMCLIAALNAIGKQLYLP